MSPVSNVDHPKHYQRACGVECVEISRDLPHALASAFEYVWRWRAKGGVEDLRKAAWWLNDWLAHSMPYTLPGRTYLALRRLRDDPDHPALYAIASGDVTRALDRVETLIAEEIADGR